MAARRGAATGDDSTTGGGRNVNPPADALAVISPKDKPWDVHRSEVQDVEAIYAQAQEFERYAQRLNSCTGLLRFAQVVDSETGEMRLRLREAHFCRVRLCPVCQWRRMLAWLARFYQAIPAIQAQFPDAKWIFLTLTVRNCDIHDLRSTLRSMNDGWNRLRLRKEFRLVTGWVRTTEVTRGGDGSAHPHFHSLLMVPPSMLAGKNYVTHAKWVNIWKSSARLDYDPVVDVRAVKPKRSKATKGELVDPLLSAVPETLKYAVKPSDMLTDAQWLFELTRQIHHARFVATGGALKDVLAFDEETADLLLADQPADEIEDPSLPRLAFEWRRDERRYRRCQKADRLSPLE